MAKDNEKPDSNEPVKIGFDLHLVGFGPLARAGRFVAAVAVLIFVFYHQDPTLKELAPHIVTLLTGVALGYQPRKDSKDE